MPIDYFSGAAKNGDTSNQLLAKIWYWVRQGGGGSGTVPSTPGTPATNTGSNNRATSQQTSTGSAVQLVAARSTRRAVMVTNADAANSVSVGSTGVTFANGDLIPPGISKVYTCVQALFIIDNGSHALVSVADEYD